MPKLSYPAGAAVVLCALAVAPAASLGQGSDCRESAFYKGSFYLPRVTLAKAVTPGREIATTIGPGCTGEGQPDTVRAVADISPRLALMRPGQTRRILLAPGFFPELRKHPLHSRLYPDGGPKPSCRSGKVVTWRYPIGPTPSGPRAGVGFLPDPSRGLIFADVYEDTKITSSVTVAGQPYVAGQYRAVSVVRKCKSGRPLVLKLSARPVPSVLDQAR